MRRLLLTVVLTLLSAMLVAAPAAAHEDELALGQTSALAQMEEPALTASDNMRHVANVPYELAYPTVEPLPHGTDIEFYTVDLGSPAETGPTTEVTRLTGPSSVATAVAVSQSAFQSAESIVLATSEDYADALAGTSLAADRGVPLLLSARDELSPETAAEIARLGATDAVLLGREEALTADVEDDLADAGVASSRIGGMNRWETAADIMDELPEATEVLLAEGEHADPQRGWPDALSAATLGAFQSRPILLAPQFLLPDETAAKLSESVNVTILGGTAAISEEVQADIDERAGTVQRIGGDDRYATSALAATEAVARGANPATTYVATGTNYADGLVSGAAAGAQDGLLILVDGLDLDASPESLQFLTDNADAIQRLFLVGSTDVLSPESETRLRETVNQPQTGGDTGGGNTGGTGGGGGESPTEQPTTDDIPVDNSDPDAEAPLAEGQRARRQFGQRDFALAGSYFNGLQIIDITDPENPEIASVYDCGILQGDVQVFARDGRTYVTYASEDTTSTRTESRCVQDGIARGDVTASDINGDGQISGRSEEIGAFGSYIIDVTDPYAPTSAGFIPVPEGTHNGTVHPSGEYFYNSDSQLIVDNQDPAGSLPEIQIFDIRDFGNIQRVKELSLGEPRPGLGTSSHDIAFNADGTRGYSAALSQNVILDTTDPANPTIITKFTDPSIDTDHQADPMTVTDSEGNERTILVVEDELIGALEGFTCPGGGVHFYDITGDKERNPLANKLGTFFIPETRPAGTPVPDGFGEAGTCTAHVFRLYPEQGIMTLGWYNAGSRVVDISGLADAPVNPLASPAEECGFAYFENSDTWSAKAYRIEDDGSFYLFSNDIIRGLDVFRYTAGTCGQ